MAYQSIKPSSELYRIEDSNILEYMKQKETETGLHLTFFQKRIFLRLLDYALSNGTRTKSGVQIYLTEKEIAKMLDASFSIVSKSFTKYEKMELVMRQRNPYDQSKITTFPNIFLEDNHDKL